MSHFDNPASMSLHEEATAAANRPMMGVFNNLVMYQQDWRRRWSRAPGSLAPGGMFLTCCSPRSSKTKDSRPRTWS